MKKLFSKTWSIVVIHSSQSIFRNELRKKIWSLSPSDWCVADEYHNECWHTHIYISSEVPIDFFRIRFLFPHSNINVGEGSYEENRDYVFKEGKYEKERVVFEDEKIIGIYGVACEEFRV